MHWNHWRRLIVGLPMLVSFLEPGSYGLAAAQATHQSDHQHGAPHGGQVVTTGQYHLEMVVKDHKTVQVYLYDNNLQPVPLPTPEATLYLRLPGNKNHTLTLTAIGSGVDASWATTTDVLHGVPTFEAAVRVALAGEARNVRFTYKDAHQHEHGNQGGKH